MWRILQADAPDDYVIATGGLPSVGEFRDGAAAHMGSDWQAVVEFDERSLRPAEVDALQGDASKARGKLGWTPTVPFKELVQIMVDADRQSLADQLAGRAVRLTD